MHGTDHLAFQNTAKPPLSFIFLFWWLCHSVQQQARTSYTSLLSFAFAMSVSLTHNLKCSYVSEVEVGSKLRRSVQYNPINPSHKSFITIGIRRHIRSSSLATELKTAKYSNSLLLWSLAISYKRSFQKQHT